MINCNYIDVNEVDLLNSAIRERQNRLRNIVLPFEPNLQLQYQFYLNPLNDLANLTPSAYTADRIKSILHLCYSDEDGAFSVVRGQIFENQNDTIKALCPYCLIGEPKTLDHYIVKSEYPEFSILINNLIPCCDFCNRTKDTNWRIGNLRSIIHFYKDTFLNYRFLYANLIFEAGNSTPKIQYSLNQSIDLSNNQFYIIENHFRILDLLNRYAARANSCLSSEITTIQIYSKLGMTPANISSLLLERYEGIIVTHGRNYWEGILYETMSQNINNLININ